MRKTPRADINSLLESLLSRMRHILQEKLVGLYLYGSLTTGDFDPESSDIDLLAATSADVTDTEFDALRAMHLDFARDDRVRARRLDEGLDILTGLWSGEPFSYQGEEYQVDNATFLPRPVQQPRIPVWVAGSWPNRRPFRRAARWDGVVPQKVPASPGAMPPRLTPNEVPEMLDYTLRHRDTDAPFDVAMGVLKPPDPDLVDSFAAAGATWLLERHTHPEALSKRLRALVS